MGKPIEIEGRVSVEEAARRLGMTAESLRHCMKYNLFPIQIGVAFKQPGAINTTYYIYERPLEKLEQFWGLVD